LSSDLCEKKYTKKIPKFVQHYYCNPVSICYNKYRKNEREEIKMAREEYLSRMIHLYGFEHPAVIQFAELIERGVNDETLKTLVECHEASPLIDEDE